MDYKNQLSIFNPEEYNNTSISIVGVGAIGSITTLILCKMGIKNVSVYDNDSVEEHNIPNQFYKLNHIGLYKTTALREVLKDFTEAEIEENGNVVDETILVSDIVVVCTDNMKARKLTYTIAKEGEISDWFIDARMNGHTYRVYTLNLRDKEQCKEYEKTLYSDENSDEGQCTAKTIIYNVAEIGAKISNQVRKILTNQKYNNMLAYDFINDILIKKDWKQIKEE